MAYEKSDYDQAGAFPNITLMSDFLIRWTECLHGSGDMRATLALLAKLTRSRLVHLSRFYPETDRQRTITCFDLDASEGKHPLFKGFAPVVLDHHGAYARPGTIWTLSEKERAGLPELDMRSKKWMENRNFGEVVIIPLGKNDDNLDVLEFYRAERFLETKDTSLQYLAFYAAEAWGRRRKGRIARFLRSVPALCERLEAPLPAGPADPLSPENPFRLTAAEIRICVMLRDGRGAEEIGLQTRTALSTVRSHLRNIYSKTGASGQIGLIHLLLGSGAGKTSSSAGSDNGRSVGAFG